MLNLKRDLIKVNIFFHPVMGLRALPGKSAQINYQHSLVRVRSIVRAAWDPCGPMRPRTRTRSQAFVFPKTWLTYLRFFFFFCIISLGCLAPI